MDRKHLEKMHKSLVFSLEERTTKSTAPLPAEGESHLQLWRHHVITNVIMTRCHPTSSAMDCQSVMTCHPPSSLCHYDMTFIIMTSSWLVVDAETPRNWVQKWVDFSHRYGLGYQLLDGTFGGVFNDNTKIYLSPDGRWVIYNSIYNAELYRTIEYYGAGKEQKKITILTEHSESQTDHQIQKKIVLLNYFKKYLTEQVNFLTWDCMKLCLRMHFFVATAFVQKVLPHKNTSLRLSRKIITEWIWYDPILLFFFFFLCSLRCRWIKSL